MNTDHPAPGFCHAVLIITLALAASTCPAQPENELADNAKHLFVDANDIIPLEDRSRRKWDCPLVADFDQDGHLDLLLTEHGLAARLYWNEGGQFSEPIEVVTGDTHGIAAGDYDRDGRVDLIIQRGGGDGKNPRNPVAYHIDRDRTIKGGEEFSDFIRSRGRAAKLVDSDNNGLLDLILTAFPLKSQTQGANILYRNNGASGFEYVAHLPQAKWMGFKMLVTDFNCDGISDFLLYGGEDMVAVKGGDGMAYEDATDAVLGDLKGISFVSSVAEIDYDNDGDFDLFITRADHPFEHETFYDSDKGRFAFFFRFLHQPFYIEELKIDGDFHLVNLQMAYPHFDVMVGAEKRKIEFHVDRHGSKELVLKPEEAEGWPSDHSEPGLYIGHLGQGVWRIGGQTHSPTAGVILNVRSRPDTLPIPDLPAYLLENRGGTFVDVTKEVGVSISEQTTASAVGDLDNNGWPDLFVVRYGNPAKPNQQILYLNFDGRFILVPDHNITSGELGATGLGAEAFDYDNDGDLDLIYGNERGRWHLYRNQLNPNMDHEGDSDRNYIEVVVGRSPTGQASPLGAVLTVEAGGHMYKRVVGATSAGFSHSFNNHLHIGLGSCRKIERAEITWPNGESQPLTIDRVNQRISAGHQE